MSKFFVGQRVRKVRGLCTGLTGVVAEIDPGDPRGLGVRADGPGVGLNADDCERPFAAGEIIFGRPDEHEPILPEGTQPSTWDACIWKPEHLRVAA